MNVSTLGTQLSPIPSVGLSVCPESVLWGCGKTADWIRIDGAYVPQGEKEVWDFFLNGVFLNRNVFNSCVKSRQYFRTDNILLETSVCSLAFRRSTEVQDRSLGLREICKNVTVITCKNEPSSSFYARLTSAQCNVKVASGSAVWM